MYFSKSLSFKNNKIYTGEIMTPGIYFKIINRGKWIKTEVKTGQQFIRVMST